MQKRCGSITLKCITLALLVISFEGIAGDFVAAGQLPKRSLNLCIDPNWLPFESLDGNEHIGIFAEIHQLLEQKTGIHTQVLKTSSWQASLDMVKSGDCDLLSGLNKTSERLKFLAFSEPFLTVPMVVIARAESSYVTSLSSLSGKVLASVEGYRIAEEVKRKYPEIHIVYYSSVQQALLAVSQGQAYATIGSILGMSYNVDQLTLNNLKVIGHTEFTGNYRIGIIKKFEHLTPIYNNAIAAIDDKKRNEIVDSWIRLMEYSPNNTGFYWKLIIGALICVLLLSIRHFYLVKHSQRLKHLNNQLNTAFEEQESLIRIFSHEYRTPIAVISSAIRLIKKDHSEYQNVATKVEMIERATDRIKNTMEIALQKGREPHSCNNMPCFSTTSLAETLKCSIALQSNANNRAQFAVSRFVDLQIAMPKPDLLCCLDNILNNAVKYSKHEIAKVTIDILSGGSSCQLSVKDEGLGIPRDALPRVKKKYYRAENASGKPGVGIGLTVVQDLLSRYGGSFDIQSQPGEGTLVTLTLPISFGNNEVPKK